MTSVKTHLYTTVAAAALAVGVFSAPATAKVSTPWGSIYAGGFGLSTPWGGISTPIFGVGNAGPGAGGHWTGFGFHPQVGQVPTGFGVSTPWGGLSTPFFGLSQEQALSIKTPFGSMYGPGFGVSTPWGGVSTPFFGVGGPQGMVNVNNPDFGISTPWGGISLPGFGISTPWGGISMPGFGVSTPWGGVSTPFFGLNGQPMMGGQPQPQIVPVMVPYPVPMQGHAAGAPGGAQPTQCMINAVPALTKSVDDCEKAGGAVPPQRTSAVQEARQ